MDEQLRQLLNDLEHKTTSSENIPVDRDVRIQVDDIEAATSVLVQNQAVILETFPESRVIHARIPVTKLESISRDDHIYWISDVTVVADLDGIPGLEMATLVGNTIEVRNNVTQQLLAKYPVPDTNFIQAVELDGMEGLELLTTNIVVFIVNPLQSRSAIVTHRTRTVRNYAVGAPNRSQVVDLDGFPGAEVVFSNVMSINGNRQPAQAVVLTARTNQVSTYQVNTPNSMTIEELDGEPGMELLFTDLLIINSFAQPARADVVTHRIGAVSTYSVGRALDFDLVDLNGLPGLEIQFVLQGGGLRVIEHRLTVVPPTPPAPATHIFIGTANQSTSNQLQVYFKTAQSPSYSEDKSVVATTPRGGGWNTVSVNMATNPRWRGTITGLMVVPTVRANGPFGIDFIRVGPANSINGSAPYVARWEFSGLSRNCGSASLFSPPDPSQWRLISINCNSIWITPDGRWGGTGNANLSQSSPFITTDFSFNVGQ